MPLIRLRVIRPQGLRNRKRFPASSIALGFGPGIREPSGDQGTPAKTLAGGFVPHLKAKGFVTAASNPLADKRGTKPPPAKLVDVLFRGPEGPRFHRGIGVRAFARRLPSSYCAQPNGIG